MEKAIGVVGLGPIGMHFVEKLIAGSYAVIVRDLDREKAERARAAGTAVAASAGELAGAADIILLALPGNPAVEAVMEGADGLLDYLRPGHIIVDTGTSSPALDRRYATLCAQRGAGFLEAPVTWRAQGLILLPAGERALFEAVEPVIRAVSYKYRYLGGSGRGQELKAVNQLLFSARAAIAAETVAYAQALGFGRAELEELLEFGLDPALYGDEFTRRSGTTRLNHKDLKYVLEIAHEAGACLPVTAAVYQAFHHTVIHGGGDDDQNGIIRYWRSLNNSEEDEN